MREPVAKRRPLIDLEEFERRLRQPNAVERHGDDPLVELARLSGGREDPFKSVFEPPPHQAEQLWDQDEFPDSHSRDAHLQDSHFHDPHFQDAAPADSHLRGHFDPHEAQASDDFAAIEAGLLGARHHDPQSIFSERDTLDAFGQKDFNEAHWADEGRQDGHGRDGGDDEIRSKKPLYLMAGIIVVGIVGIGASFAFKGSVSGPREIATIRAADGPVKIQPEASATADAPAQDASILNRNSQPMPVSLANNVEQPVDLSQANKDPYGANTGVRGRSDDGAMVGAASVPVPPPPEPTQPRVQAQREPLSITSLIEPKKVRTVSVRPDLTILPNDKPPPSAVARAPQAEPRAAGDASRAATPKTTARVATTPKPAAAESGQPSSSAAAAKATPVHVAEATPGAAPSKAAQTAGAGAFAVQLAAPESEQEARDIQTRLMKKLGNELAGFHPAIRKAAVGAKTVYRVRVPNLSHEEAVALCQKIQGGGGACFVAKN